MYRLILSAYDPAGNALFHNNEYMGRSMADAISKMQAALAPYAYSEERPVMEVGDRGTGRDAATATDRAGDEKEHGKGKEKPHDRVNASGAAQEDETDQ